MPTVARITMTECGCGFRGELFFEADKGWARPCPDCGKTVNPGGGSTQRTYGNRRFDLAGGKSMTQGWHPSEAKRAAQLMPKTGHCIDTTTGDVHFPDSKTEQAYRKELAGVHPDSAKSLKELGIRP